MNFHALNSRIPYDLDHPERPRAVENLWNHLTKYQRHCILMSLFRFETEKDLNGFIEIARFKEMKISPFNLPNFVLRMTPEQLKREAFLEIGRKCGN